MVEVDYAKATPTDICMRIRVTNAGPEADTLHVLPTLWFRNTWSWGGGHPVRSCASTAARIVATHWRAGTYHLDPATAPDGDARRRCSATTRPTRDAVRGSTTVTAYPKDGINDHVVTAADTVNPETAGTKAALVVPARRSSRARPSSSGCGCGSRPDEHAATRAA